MDREIVDNQEPKKIKQPVIRMDYCSEDCTGCSEDCAHNIDLTKSFLSWVNSKFSRSKKDKS
ncbi:hypothetical protein ACFLVP_03970 [Chloroflexota bacterium]